MKSNLLINIGEDLWKKPKIKKNQSTKFSSLINNKSLTTNTSGTTFTTPPNSIYQNKEPNIFINKKLKLKKINSKFSSLNILTNFNYNDKYTNNIVLPQIKTPKNNIKILKKADTLIKLRHGKYAVHTLKQTVSSLLQKSNQICLNKFLITQIKNKRNEINNLSEEINSKLNEAEYQYQSDYRDFLIFEENINKKIKSQAEQYNKLQKSKINAENTYMEAAIKSQHLEAHIESMTKQIILSQNYAKFIHKFFNSPFFFDELSKINLKEKKYLNIYEKIISIFEKNKKIFEENYKILNESEEFMKRFKYFERKIINSFQIKDEIKEEINDLKILNNKLLEQLYLRRDDCEQEYQSLNDILLKTKEEINDLDNIKQNNLINLEICKKCIFDLGIYLGLEINNNVKEISLSEFAVLCKKIISFLKEKENIVNEYISNIDELIQRDENDFIWNIINERKKINKIEKYREYLYNQNIEAQKRKFKVNTIDRKIVLKGRKVFRDIPIIKKKKKKLKIKINNENETFEYLHYYSDQDDL